MAKRRSNSKVANSVVAMSSAAVLAVYAVGYARTESAAERLETLSVERRPPAPQQPPRQTIAPVAEHALPVPVAKPAPRTVVAKREAVPEPVAVESAPTAVDPVPVPAPEPSPGPAPAPPPPPPAPVWKDGTYTGWGTSRHGDIQASVVIEGGRIASATIAQCLTRYSCDVIDKLPPEVAQRQSPEVDYVSGATQSANAFYYAVVEALGKAK